MTNLDLLIEDNLRQAIIAEYPEDSIFGEERFNLEGKTEFSWIIDPIDGTFGFSKGVPLFGTLIGYMRENIPLFGFMRLPMIDDACLSGSEKAAFLNGKKVSVREFCGWNDSLIVTTDESTLANSAIGPLWKDIISRGAMVRTWGDCFGYYLLCTGKVDLMADTGLKAVDILPILPILEGAGASVETFGSNQYQDIGAFFAGALENCSNLV